MKKARVIGLGMTLAVASLSAHAATEVSSMTGENVYGHVSATGANTLDNLTAALGKKADAAGASKFYITSAGGKNKLHGSAILLK